MRHAITLFVLLALAGAASLSIRLARADAAYREGTPEGVARAIEEMPGNAAYLAFGALQADYEGRDATPLLERIVALTPRVSAARIRLGLGAEQRGDFVVAERWLREAYGVDHQFVPRWTLANFYLRQGRNEDFWLWIRTALAISYGDRRPAFDLCWSISSDADEILTRAIPDREEVASDYLAYLIDHHQVEALAAAAQKVHGPDLLLAATDVLLDNSRYAEATAVWRLSGRRVPDGITGPNFEAPQTGHGFDWRRFRSEGVRHPFPGRIQLSGQQAESVELLRQFVGGLHPGERYTLQWKASVEVPGLTWKINGEPAAEFVASSEVAVVSLWYQRPLGEVRAEASFDISGVSLLALH
ncbi:MAG: hypothetical protein ABIR70_04555 [Bryobacteraceae bacterium]